MVLSKNMRARCPSSTLQKTFSEGLAKVACLGEVDGEEEDLRTVIDHDCQLNILTARMRKVWQLCGIPQAM